MKKTTLGLLISASMACTLVSSPTIAQNTSGAMAQVSNWVCTVRDYNPMAGMNGGAPFNCIQWSNSLYTGAIGNMSGMSGMNGQAGGYSVVLSGVSFRISSSSLTQPAKNYLQQLLARLPRHPGVQYKVVGHADSAGSTETNLSLSLQRAEAVKAYFVENGLNPNQIEAIGRGESEPVASNETPAGRILNRRVELYVF